MDIKHEPKPGRSHAEEKQDKPANANANNVANVYEKRRKITNSQGREAKESCGRCRLPLAGEGVGCSLNHLFALDLTQRLVQLRLEPRAQHIV